MKIRNGFVSNSSSSSFWINLKDLSGAQLVLILNNDYKDQGNPNPTCGYEKWETEVKEGHVVGTTELDNYSMEDFFEKIGVNGEIVHWGGYWFGESDFDRLEKHYESPSVLETVNP